jgi:hypothetical protein
MNIVMINGEPYFTPKAQLKLNKAKSEDHGFVRFTQEADVKQLKKDYPKHYKNMTNTFIDKVYKSREIICGIHCNTVWQATIATFMGWNIHDTIVYINALQSSNDAILCNTATNEFKSLELKHTSGELKLINRKNARNDEKGRPGFVYDNSFKFHCGGQNKKTIKKKNFKQEITKYQNNEELGLFFTTNDEASFLGAGQGILDAWILTGPEVANFLLAKKDAKSFPISISPNTVFSSSATVLQKLDVNTNRIYNYLKNNN